MINKLCMTLAAGLLGALALSGTALAVPAADALKARHAEFAPQLARNDFGREMHIESTASGNMLSGEIHAVLDHPFARMSSALREPAAWCDVLILPFNTKYCRAQTQGPGGQPMLNMRIGRKFDQPLKDAYPLELDWRLAASGNDYFEARLTAASGPMGTRDYRIAVEAVPIDARRTFLHLSYAYAYGLTGRLAMLEDSDPPVIGPYFDMPSELIGGGTAEIQLTIISSMILGLPRK